MGSVIDLLNKYRSDPFFRTEINVVSLQAVFALVILALVWTSSSMLDHDVSEAIINGIRAGIGSSDPASLGPSIVLQIDQIRTQHLADIVLIIIGTTVVFGYIIARVTLAPARSALAAQKQFIGNIAHELRTPLSVIKTNSEVALLEDNMSTDIKQVMQSNIEELDRLSETINNLLSLSALVRPERIEFSAIDLSTVVSETVERFSQLAKRGEHQITVRKGPDTVVWGNATALTQIVGNLLKNAISYTPRNGYIRISVEPAANNYVELLVQDSGIGIPRKDLYRIFEPFYRGDPSRTRSQGGTGLGLAIVSELVKMHHGKIAIRSGVGRGTTISICFPGIAGHGVVGQEAHSKNILSEITVDFSSHKTSQT